MTLSLDDIAALPIGAIYQSNEGNATGTLKKNNNNEIEFTANCDSLWFVIEKLNKEVHRYQSDSTAFKTTLNEHTITEVNKLSGWQWFQIYGFRVCIVIAAIIIIYKRIKKYWVKRFS
ncbi:hypothetical protein [Dysgonomonas sp. 520]|uniref:hypothetical protein n=1 Tax=Dysgonomonas sp. 520 TaxID=2302931 RepID=UPI0013D074A5|nr:hypothetical protein [Dysgonomonas sp. 520]NDW10454.1 hypothetical protein [Dysgonomonas sp. 520]